RLTCRVLLVNLALAVRLVSVSSAGYASVVLTETWFEPVFLGLLILLGESLQGRVEFRWWTIGVLFAVGFLFRPAMAAMLPVLVVAAWMAPTWRVTARRLAILGGVSALLIGPWCARNAIVCGQATPVIFLGRELWVSVYSPGSPAGPPLPDTPEAATILEKGGDRLNGEAWRHNWTVSTALTDAGSTDAEADRGMRVVAWQGLRRDPLRWVVRCGWRTVDLWRSIFSREQAIYGGTPQRTAVGADQILWGTDALRGVRDRCLDASLETRLLPVELGSLLGLLGVCGLCLHPRLSHWGLLVALTLGCTAVMTGVLEIPNHRYRLVLEPLLIVGALTGGAVWVEIIRRGRRDLVRELQQGPSSADHHAEIRDRK
ncbi:MAG TPA: hypothetical protein VFG20_02140, partial [Planctomycetaceae bacterium]|nr:hypothetical protein [Planctomycetaceae bacterium]